jgi:hypothetical protein
MLAKIWKKLLLAICIIACIYNIMNKLVSRKSLESNLRSIINQTSIIKSHDNDDDNPNTENIEYQNTTTIEDDNNSIVVIY